MQNSKHAYCMFVANSDSSHSLVFLCYCLLVYTEKTDIGDFVLNVKLLNKMFVVKYNNA